MEDMLVQGDTGLVLERSDEDQGTLILLQLGESVGVHQAKASDL